jgi:hypothetical protein
MWMETKMTMVARLLMVVWMTMMASVMQSVADKSSLFHYLENRHRWLLHSISRPAMLQPQ